YPDHRPHVAAQAVRGGSQDQLPCPPGAGTQGRNERGVRSAQGRSDYVHHFSRGEALRQTYRRDRKRGLRVTGEGASSEQRRPAILKRTPTSRQAFANSLADWVWSPGEFRIWPCG